MERLRMLRSLNRSFKRINCCLNGTHLPPLIWEKSFQSIGGRMTRRMARNPPSGSGGKLRMISGWVGTCANAAMASQPEMPHVPAAEKISAGSSPGGQGGFSPDQRGSERGGDRIGHELTVPPGNRCLRPASPETAGGNPLPPRPLRTRTNPLFRPALTLCGHGKPLIFTDNYKNSRQSNGRLTK